MLNLSQRMAHERLTRICFIDYDREMALVAETKDAETGEPRIVAVGRLKGTYGANEAEFALIISDAYQGRVSAPRCSAASSTWLEKKSLAALPETYCQITSSCSASARSWDSS